MSLVDIIAWHRKAESEYRWAENQCSQMRDAFIPSSAWKALADEHMAMADALEALKP